MGKNIGAGLSFLTFSILQLPMVASAQQVQTPVVSPIDGRCPAGFQLMIRGQQTAQQGYVGTRVCERELVPDTAVRLPPGSSGVVKIWVTCDGQTWTGAGAIVSEAGHVLTAGHVGSACIGRPGTVIEIGPVKESYSEPSITWRATLVERVADGKVSPTKTEAEKADFQDIALYQIDRFEPRVPTIPLASALPVAGDPLSIWGFSNLPVDYPGSEQPLAGISVAKTSLFSAAARRGVPFRLHYVAMTLPGLSGGPVTDTSGALVGVHSALRRSADQWNYFGWGTATAALPIGWWNIIAQAGRFRR